MSFTQSLKAKVISVIACNSMSKHCKYNLLTGVCACAQCSVISKGVPFQMFLKSFLLSVLIVFNVSIEDEDVQSRDIWGCNVAEADYDRGAVPFRVCSSPVEMVEWDNETLVGIFEDVESELECWGACEQEPACNFYSFSSQAKSLYLVSLIIKGGSAGQHVPRIQALPWLTQAMPVFWEHMDQHSLPKCFFFFLIVSLFVWSSVCFGDCLFVVSLVHCKLSELHTCNKNF